MHYVGTPESSKLLGKSGYRWEDNIKMNLEKVGFELHSVSSE
jgi:hypothetical protein